MPHHYDAHDHDKLLRWRDDLQANPFAAPAVASSVSPAPPRPDDLQTGPIAAAGFPAVALFLVKPTTTAAHEIFRRYRTEFERREATFAHLVIFGMHGVSTSVRALLKSAGLSETNLPVMLLAPASDPTATVAIQLPAGASIQGGDDPNGDGTCDYLAPWQDALDRIRVAQNGRPLRLLGVQSRPLPDVDLRQLPATALTRLPQTANH